MTIDRKISFKSINIAILVISDTRNRTNDRSGKLLSKLIIRSGHAVVDNKIVKDEKNEIRKKIKQWISDKNIQAIISTGGTGITSRDITPEVFQEFFEKEITGFGETFRMISFRKIGTSTIQSRAIAGVSKKTLLFALPGSPGACQDAWDKILKWQLDSRFRPCNFIELIPKL
tara:strand:- start:1342 stop:1860 length:519 start_codon:yes stop_codon:yes gene_type:complete